MTEAQKYDDGPPPLEDMSEKLAALRFKKRQEEAKKGTGRLNLDDLIKPENANRRLEAAAAALGKPPGNEPAAPKSAPAAKPLKRGFFDAAPAKKGPAQETKMPVLKAKPPNARDGKHIPDFLRVKQEPTKLDDMKKKMIDVLQPTPDLLKDVVANKEVATGLDDPEIMAAVAEIAKDPSAIKKYANNRKIVAFYSEMGKLMGSRLEKAGQRT